MDFVRFCDRLVSRFALGTAALGGVPYPEGAPVVKSPEDVVLAARRIGITVFDTAPTYGNAESLLGRLLDPCSINAGFVVTKWRPEQILEQSRIRLRRAPDLVLLHAKNLDELVAWRGLRHFWDSWPGWPPVVGASVYTPEEASEAMARGARAIQIPLSVANQSCLPVLEEARRRRVSVMIRSVLVRGALAEGRDGLPRVSVREAVRFALAAAPGAVLVMGCRSVDEVEMLDRILEAPIDPTKDYEPYLEMACADPVARDPAKW